MGIKNQAVRVSPADIQKEHANHAFKQATEAAPTPAAEVVEERAPTKQDRAKEPKKNIRIEIPESIHKALKLYALENDATIQQYVSQLIEDSLKRKKLI